MVLLVGKGCAVLGRFSANFLDHTLYERACSRKTSTITQHFQLSVVPLRFSRASSLLQEVWVMGGQCGPTQNGLHR